MIRWIGVILVGVLVLGSYCKDNVASDIDPSCFSPNCSCCLDSEQCLNGTCDGQCKIGYFGPGCNFPCPDSCIQCKNHNAASGSPPLFLDVANCTECIDGHFSTSDIFQCQHACPDPCHSCESDSICTLCKDGYFLEGTLCETCESSCATCASFSECRSCVLGFYLEGLVCKPCSSGCVSQCDKLSGTCSCKTRFRGDKCENCVTNFEGANCDKRKDDCNGDTCSDIADERDADKSVVAALGGGIAAAAVLMIVAVILLVFLRRWHVPCKRSNDSNEAPRTIPATLPDTNPDAAVYVNVEDRPVRRESDVSAQELRQKLHKYEMKGKLYAKKMEEVRATLQLMERQQTVENNDGYVAEGAGVYERLGHEYANMDGPVYNELAPT